jgi:hypothetical protein
MLFSFSLNAQAQKTLLTELSDYFDNKGTSVADFTPHGTQPGINHSLTPVNNCNSCHNGGSNDKTFMPYPTWAGSMMANATRDPLFWAAVDVANNDVPGVGDFCIRCHAPKGFYNGHTKDASGVNSTDYANGCGLGGSITQTNQAASNEYEGVECHFCHRIEELGPSGEALIANNSNVWFDDANCGNLTVTCRKGPYDYTTDTTVSEPPHAWEYSEFISEGAFCGTCHNVSSPEIQTQAGFQIAKTLIDTDGTDTGIAFPIERTYEEWKNSKFSDLLYQDGFGGTPTVYPVIATGQTCQDCHMPQTEDTNARACVFSNNGDRADNLSTHEFAGGNSWMPQVLKNQYSSLNRSAAFDLATNNALKMLQQQSALVEISSTSLSSNQLTAEVKITNLTGHKLPTGYPEGRRMWINFKVKNTNGSTFFESGAYNTSTAVLNTTNTKIYETLQGIWDANTTTCVTESNGNKLFHFALNNCVAKDNRIPPLGFRGVNNIEIKPVGITYPSSPSNPQESVNYDKTTYNIDISSAVLPVTVEVTLKYQSSSKDYIEFLDNESSNNNIPSENNMCNRTQTTGPANQNRAAFMKTLWENNGKSAPVDMGTDSVIIN